MTKPEILFISIDPYENRSRLLNHIAAAIKADYKVSVLATSSSIKSQEPQEPNRTIFPVHLRQKRGFAKFFQFNLTIFKHLKQNQYDVIYSRGIWAFPALWFYLLQKKTPLIYDAHEYFPGLEIMKKSWIKRFIWLNFEKAVGRKASVLLTVSDPILEKYNQLLPEIDNQQLIRNLPSAENPGENLDEENNLSFDKPVILFHGYFMPSRGLENLVLAMKSVDNAILLFVGEGLLGTKLKSLVQDNELEKKVLFKPMIPNNQLIGFARQASIGVSLLEPVSDNHRFALPNKFFEYMMAGLPVLVSEKSILETYVKKYKTGLSVNPKDPTEIASKLNEMLSNPDRMESWSKNSTEAARELNWENEEKKLIKVFEDSKNTKR